MKAVYKFPLYDIVKPNLDIWGARIESDVHEEISRTCTIIILNPFCFLQQRSQ